MHTRNDLQLLLETFLNSRNVYFQPPENLKMNYPCIRYSISDITDFYADGLKYNSVNVYDIVVIDKMPNNPVIKKILELPYSSFDRHYVSEELNHDIIKLYY